MSVAALVVGSLTTALSGTAQAVALPCGAVIGVSTTLTANVGPCPGTALFVVGNGVVLNLNGHHVLGTPGPGEGPGIYLAGATNAQVINGTVSHFDTGIYIEFGAGHNTVMNMNVFDNVGGLQGQGIFGEGIQIYQSNNNRILRNRVLRNGTFAGIDVFDASGTLIEGNLVAQNNIGQVGSSPPHGPSIMQDIGIWIVFLEIPTTNNVVSHNQVIGNGLDGIQFSRFSSNNVARANQLSDNGFGQTFPFRDGDGIAVFGRSNLIEHNRVVRSAAHGIAVVAGGTGNRVVRNQVAFSALGPHPSPNFDLFDQNAGCDANIWSGNAFTTFNQACVTL